jgi:hypothetical protein
MSRNTLIGFVGIAAIAWLLTLPGCASRERKVAAKPAEPAPQAREDAPALTPEAEAKPVQTAEEEEAVTAEPEKKIAKQD